MARLSALFSPYSGPYSATIWLREMVPSQLVLDLDVLVYIRQVVVKNAALIVALSVLSLVVPMTRIGKIRPVQIINNRD